MRIFARGSFIVSLLLLFISCDNAAVEGLKRPMVLVSIRPQAFFVKRIAGDEVDVEVMIPANANPETFEPSMNQLRSFSQGKLYIILDHPQFPFERDWLRKLLAETPGITVRSSSASFEYQQDDPHIWLSPQWGRVMVSNTLSALKELLPDQAEQFSKNAKIVLEELDRADARIKVLLAKSDKKRFVVFHPAWGYFAKYYQLEQIAIEDEGKEPDAAQLGQRIERIRGLGITTLFFDPQISRERVDMVASEINAEPKLADTLAYEWISNLEQMAQAIAGTQ